jgi:hypothetical protein
VRALDAFLDALAQLEASNDFLQQHSSLAAVQAAVEHSQVRQKGGKRRGGGAQPAGSSVGSRRAQPGDKGNTQQYGQQWSTVR